MTDEPESLTLRMLGAIDPKIDRVLDDLADIKPRLTSVERQVGELRVDLANQSSRIDRIDVRLDRMERRLELSSTVS